MNVRSEIDGMYDSTTPAPPAGANERRIENAVWLAAALSLPLAVLFSGAYELFPVPGWVDPMIYFGYFLDPAGQMSQFGPLYFALRAPFVALGSFFYEIFSPAYAHLALVSFFHLLAIGSIYGIARRIGGPLSGTIAAWWLGTNPIWIASVGSGYIDAPAMAFGLAAIACALSAASAATPRQSVVPSIGAGVLLALTLGLHPIPAALAGAAVLMVCLLVTSLAPRVLRLALIVAGGAAGLLLLGLYSWCIGGPFLFLFYDQTPIVNAFAGRARPFIRPLGDWLPDAFRLATPVVVLVVALGTLMSRSDARPARAVVAACGFVAVLLMGGFMLAWDVGVGGLTAQTRFYASYLLIGQGLLMAYVGAVLIPSRTLPTPRDLLTLTALVLAVAVPLLFRHQLAMAVDGAERIVVWIALGIAALALAAAAAFRLGRTACAGLFLVTAIAGTANVDTRRAFAVPGTVSYRAIFELAVDVRKAVDNTMLAGRRVFLWLDRSGFTTGDGRSDQRATYDFYFDGRNLGLNAFDSIAALWLWDKSILNFEMPNLSAGSEAKLKQKDVPTTIVMICSYRLQCNQAHLKMDEIGIPTELRARSLIWKPGLHPLNVLVVDYFLKSAPPQ